MKQEQGDARNIEVVRLIREHIGKDVLLGVDANNGYNLAGAKRFWPQPILPISLVASPLQHAVYGFTFLLTSPATSYSLPFRSCQPEVKYQAAPAFASVCLATSNRKVR